MRTPETAEKTAIIRHLKEAGAWFCRTVPFGYGAMAGVPDIIACHRGRFVGVEVKRDGKEPTPLQRKRLREIAEAGGLAFWGTAEKVVPELIAHGIVGERQ